MELAKDEIALAANGDEVARLANELGKTLRVQGASPPDGISALISAFTVFACRIVTVAPTMEGRKQNLAAMLGMLEAAKADVLAAPMDDASSKREAEACIGRAEVDPVIPKGKEEVWH